MTAAIQTSGLCKTYGPVRAVIDLDLVVESGQVFAFLGPNGAGKPVSGLWQSFARITPWSGGCQSGPGPTPRRHTATAERAYISERNSLTVRPTERHMDASVPYGSGRLPWTGTLTLRPSG